MWADHGMTPYRVMPAVRRLMKKEIYKETSQETDDLLEKTLLGYIYLKK